MYKVFFNEKLIAISGRENITLNKPTQVDVENWQPGDLRKWFVTVIESSEKEVLLVHSDPEKFFGLFRSVFVSLPAAGGVVRREGNILFIYRNGKWDLPKGKIEPGEKAATAALREVEEECGISGHKMVKQLPSTYHIYQSPYKKSKGEWIFKETSWYEMAYDGDGEGIPQTGEGITAVKWFSKQDLGEVLENTYENLKQIIALYLR